MAGWRIVLKPQAYLDEVIWAWGYFPYSQPHLRDSAYILEIMANLLRVLAVACAIYGCAVLGLKNPLIPGFVFRIIFLKISLIFCSRWNPDPHVLRVNDTYYVAVSSFLTFPGIPIYSSKDLANWELVSHAIDSPSKIPLNGIKQDNGGYF